MSIAEHDEQRAYQIEVLSILLEYALKPHVTSDLILAETLAVQLLACREALTEAMSELTALREGAA